MPRSIFLLCLGCRVPSHTALRESFAQWQRRNACCFSTFLSFLTPCQAVSLKDWIHIFKEFLPFVKSHEMGVTHNINCRLQLINEGPGVVVHACNPSFFGSRDRRIMV
jgi:hypothetical protein